MSSAWELLSSERLGQAGHRTLVAKTFRMPDGSEKAFTVTEFAPGAVAAAVVALTVRGTVVLAEQYRPGPGRMNYDAYSAMPRHYFLATGCEQRHDQRLDPGEFVTVREVTPGELLTLAMAGAMTDPGGVLLALPYLTGDPQVLALLVNSPS